MSTTKVKLAATILLGRDGEDGFEILLLKRNKALAFAAGLWVFPGGKIESFEIEKSENELEAASLAAIRETMEEADIEIDSNDLVFFSHWTTPEIQPRRFAAWFFFANVNNINSDVKIDDSEIKDHIWIAPQAALDKVKRGDLAMMPPTLISLQLIRKCQSAKEAYDLLNQFEPIFILPVLKFEGSKMLSMYEGDVDYDASVESSQNARHRLILDMKSGDYSFEYNNCENFKPINGGMHL